MIIGVDLRCLPADGSPAAGIAHATRALVRHLLHLSSEGIAWILYLPRGAQLVESGGECSSAIPTRQNHSIVTLPHSRSGALRGALRSHPCDLLFVPSGAVALGISTPCIPWVHDIAIFQHPEWFSESSFRRAFTTRLFRRGVCLAPRVLSASEHTKYELVRQFRLDPQRIVVTDEGGDDVLATLQGKELFSAKQRARERLAERGIIHPYILFLGTLEPRKNLPTLLEAWIRTRDHFVHPVDLVIAGQTGWKVAAIEREITHRNAQILSTRLSGKIHRFASVSDDERRSLLLAADLVAIPSLHEGFGLVALEAMQAGTAVIVSNAGALPDVVGDAGMFVSPLDIEAWTSFIIQLMNNASLRRRLAERGKQRSQSRTWTRTAQKVLQALTRAAI